MQKRKNEFAIKEVKINNDTVLKNEQTAIAKAIFSCEDGTTIITDLQ